MSTDPALEQINGPDGNAGAAPAAASSSSTPTGFVSTKPILMIGAAGDDVAELGYLLAGHGFTNAISEGKASAPPMLDDALMKIVVDFQAAKGIDPYAGENGGSPAFNRQAHIGVVDARTWEALLGYAPTVTPQGAAG